MVYVWNVYLLVISPWLAGKSIIHEGVSQLKTFMLIGEFPLPRLISGGSIYTNLGTWRIPTFVINGWEFMGDQHM